MPAAAAAQARADGGNQVRALLKPRAEATISGEIAARIVSMPFRDGQAFKAGEVLVGFDCALYRATADRAAAALQGTEKKLDNDRRLAAGNAIGKLEVELSEAEVAKARAELRGARVQTDRCAIRAPFAGRVVAVRAHAHEFVSPGKELLDIVDDGPLEVEVIVPSSWLVWLKPGLRFELVVDETGSRLEVPVTKLGARVDAVSQTVKAWGAIPSGAIPSGAIQGPSAALLAGMSGTATFAVP